MTTSFQLDGEDDGPLFQFTALQQNDRVDIVELSSNFNLGGAAYVDANTLELSALGANTDLLGQWNPPPAEGIDLVGWHHIAVTGRDIYVKIVRRGWLFPLGHQAVLIELIERVIEPDPESPLYAQAYLGKKTYVRVTQPTKTYPAAGQPFGTNDWPFQSVRILTSVSPQLDATLAELTDLSNPVNPGTTGPAAQALVLTYGGGTAVPWSVVATDLVGNELHLQVPLIFVFGQDSASNWPDEFNESKTQPWVDAYNQVAETARTVAANGQKMRFAPEAGGPSGGTTHPVVSLTLGAARPSADPNTPNPPASPAHEAFLINQLQPAFYPVIAKSSVRLKAADAMSGKQGGFSDGGGNGVSIQYFPDFVEQGLPESDPPDVPLSGVYAQLTQAASSATGPLLKFPSNNVGGIGNPNMLMSGLSAITGPVGGALSDLQDFANNGAMDVQNFFKSLSSQGDLLPQLFGSLKLSDILGSFIGDVLGGIPNLTTTTDPDTGDTTVEYKLTANLQSFPSSDPIFVPQSDPSSFNLTAKAIISTSKPPTYDVEGSITPFNIYLVSQNDLAFIEIPFQEFSFTSKSGSKTKVHVSVGSVSFIGALSFVNTLEQFLQDIGGSGLSIAVTPSEVDANFSVALPDVALGALTLSGIAFSAGVKVPFLGDPALVTFGFASQANPFTLTVCMFGGGGFLSLGLGFAGVQTVQASFEFAGQFALDIGVASGGISLTAGIYYSYSALPGPSQGTTLTGFVKMNGEVEVLGIISVSAELDLTLTYTSGPSGSSVTGTATLKISVSICFFSITVPITVTKTWSGGGASASAAMAAAFQPLGAAADPAIDPNVQGILFDDLVPTLSVWQTYCGAFAD